MAKAMIQLAAEIDIREVLPAISVPTLVLHRTGDRLWPVEGARFVAEQIPGAQLVELDGQRPLPVRRRHRGAASARSSRS